MNCLPTDTIMEVASWLPIVPLLRLLSVSTQFWKLRTRFRTVETYRYYFLTRRYRKGFQFAKANWDLDMVLLFLKSIQSSESIGYCFYFLFGRAFGEAILRKDNEAISVFKKLGNIAGPSGKYAMYFTPLTMASQVGNLEMIEYCFQHVPDWTSVMYGAAVGRHKWLIQQLEVQGENAKYGFYGAVKANDMELIEFFLQKVDISQCVDWALRMATLKDNIPLIQFLLSKSTQPELDFAFTIAHSMQAVQLLKTCRFAAWDGMKKALKKGHMDVIWHFVEYSKQRLSPFACSLLMDALQCDLLSVVAALEVTTEPDWTQMLYFGYINEVSDTTLKYILSKGANIHKAVPKYWSTKNQIEFVSYLESLDSKIQTLH